MIEFREASRWYGPVIGLNDVTCTIGPGVTALLGQNGAGKSTLMRLATGQLRPTTGQVKVFGLDPFANPDVFRRLGHCPDADAFPEHLSGRKFVRRMARLAGFEPSEADGRAEKSLQLVGMADRADRPLQGYSKGMRQRIKLAQAIVHEPDVLLLDEPLNGLDPVGRKEFMSLLEAYAEGGRSVVVSSHVLFEVERMTNTVVLLHHGRLLASGDVRDIRDVLDRHPRRVRIGTPEPRQWAAWLVSSPAVVEVHVDSESVEARTTHAEAFFAYVERLVIDEGLALTSLSSPDAGLEAVYQYLVAS